MATFKSMTENVDTKYFIALCIFFILMIIYFNDEYQDKINNYFNPKNREEEDKIAEHLSDLKDIKYIKKVEATPSEKLKTLGYTENASWEDRIKAEDLDESVFVGHRDYVKDVSRFSSGANFTSVADDNTSFAFSNFVGLRRPQNVFVGNTARQQPDIDQTVLMRNKDLRFTGDVSFRHE